MAESKYIMFRAPWHGDQGGESSWGEQGTKDNPCA